MLASVFQLEMLLGGRKQRPYVLRWLYAVFLLALLTPLLFSSQSLTQWVDQGGYHAFFQRFVVLHFGLLLLLTPGIVAGALSDEKTTGTLQHLLTAPLWPIEIVLGKLFARTLQLVLLSMAGLPLVTLFCGMGGDPWFPVAMLVLSLACIFGLAGVSLLASAWCRTTRDALLTVYVSGVIVVSLASTGAWPWLTALAARLSPVAVLAEHDADRRWPFVVACLIMWLIVGVVGTLLAALCLRWAYLRQLRAVSRGKPRWWQVSRPPMGVNPVLWRERWVEGIAPLPSLRAWPRWLAMLCFFAASAWSLAWLLDAHLPAGRSVWQFLRAGDWSTLRFRLRASAGVNDVFYAHGMALLVLANFLVAIRASGSIAGERDKGTWQALLLTPMPTPNIVRGKHWGVVAAFVPYLVAYALAALPWALFVGAGATAWTVLWIVATLFAVQYVSAVGLWCSVLWTNSWIAMTVAALYCYATWMVLAVPLGAVFFIGQTLVGFVLEAVASAGAAALWQALNPFAVALGFSLVAAFWLLTRHLFIATERLIAKRDRAKEIDPQFQTFYDRWLRQIEQKRRKPAEIVPLPLDEPLPLHD
jgi:ABC-type transport system involved in multi-copper enzyme maturation permease subunit